MNKNASGDTGEEFRGNHNTNFQLCHQFFLYLKTIFISRITHIDCDSNVFQSGPQSVCDFWIR